MHCLVQIKYYFCTSSVQFHISLRWHAIFNSSLWVRRIVSVYMHAMHWLVSFWQSALLKIDGKNQRWTISSENNNKSITYAEWSQYIAQFSLQDFLNLCYAGILGSERWGAEKKLLRIMKIWHYVLTAEIYYKSCLLQVYTSITQWFSNASEHLACLQPTSSNYCFRFAAIISLATSHLGQINCKNLVWTKRECTITLYIEAECNTFIKEWP